MLAADNIVKQLSSGHKLKHHQHGARAEVDAMQADWRTLDMAAYVDRNRLQDPDRHYRCFHGAAVGTPPPRA
jgi:hypothetical protein